MSPSMYHPNDHFIYSSRQVARKYGAKVFFFGGPHEEDQHTAIVQ